jgi:hypothetical protein
MPDFDRYRKVMEEHLRNPSDWSFAPDFVGSLTGLSIYRDKYWDKNIEYLGLPSQHKGLNIALQLMLWKASRVIVSPGCDPLFAFPPIPLNYRSSIVITRGGPPES